jgi:hypothetical protein
MPLVRRLPEVPRPIGSAVTATLATWMLSAKKLPEAEDVSPYCTLNS